MACHLLGAKPLLKSILTYYQLDPVKFLGEFNIFIKKYIWKIICVMTAIFVQAGMRYLLV